MKTRFIWVNGVRLRVTEETYQNFRDEERQEKIHRMNQRDKEERLKRNELWKENLR